MRRRVTAKERRLVLHNALCKIRTPVLGCEYEENAGAAGGVYIILLSMTDVVPEPPRRSNGHLPGGRLSGRIKLLRGDITEQRGVDALVAAVPRDLDLSGSLNRALIRAAGPGLEDFVHEHIFKPRPGDVFALPAFALPVKSILYVITPEWRSGFEREEQMLLRCYRRAIETAQNMGLKKIALPALGTGEFGYPAPRAARLALQGIKDRMDGRMEEIRIVCNKDDVYAAFAERVGK